MIRWQYCHGTIVIWEKAGFKRIGYTFLTFHVFKSTFNVLMPKKKGEGIHRYIYISYTNYARNFGELELVSQERED